MFDCNRCRKTIEEVSSSNRYCPYCGTAYVLPCSNPHCDKERGLVVIGKTSVCKQCGQLYRYNPDTRDAIRTDSTGPFYTSTDAAGRTIADLLPSSGCQNCGTAILAGNQHTVTAPEELVIQTRIAYPQARHGRIYVMPLNGRLLAFHCSSLKAAGGWRAVTPEDWKPEFLSGLHIQVSESLVYIVLADRIQAYDAGRGTPAFRFNLTDISNVEALIYNNRILVVGISDNHQVVRLYDVCKLIKQPGASALIWEDCILQDARPSRYSFRPSITADDGGFSVASFNGDILRIGKDGGKATLFENFALRQVYAWATGVSIGAVLCQGDTPDRWDLNVFSIDPGVGLSYTKSLDSITPEPSLHRLIIQDNYVLFMDAEGYLQRQNLMSRGSDCDSWPVLVGSKPDEVVDMFLMPIEDGNPTVVVHSREMWSHRFRGVRLGSGHQFDLNSKPQSNDAACGVFCGRMFFVCNMNDGWITPQVM